MDDLRRRTPPPSRLPFDLWETHVTLLLTGSADLARVTAIAPTLAQLFRGSVGFVVVNLAVVPHASLNQFGLDVNRLYLPSLAFITKGTTTVSALLNQYDDVVGFINDQLIKYMKAMERHQREEVDWEDLEVEMDSVPDVLKHDDELELSLPEGDNFESIQDLSADDYTSSTKSRDFFAVIAYLPWDPASRALLWELVTLSSPLRRHLGRLNCLDWTDLCDELGVRSHPQLITTAAGHARLHSTSPTRARLRELLSVGPAPVPLVVEDTQIELWTTGQVTGSPLDGTSRALVLPTSLRLPPNALTRLRGTILVASLEDSQVFSRFGKNAAHCLKRNDPFQPAFEVDLIKLEESISRCEPVLSQLTEENFDRLRPTQWTFVLFCTPPACPRPDVTEALVQAAGHVALSEADFYWMNSSDPVARLARQQYEVTAAVALVAVNMTSGEVVQFSGRPQLDELQQWVTAVRAGLITGKVLLKPEQWHPVLPPIDFGSPAATLAPGGDAAETLAGFQGASDGSHGRRGEL
ncbi:thioredoxin domain-containing protein 16-like [Pollicipes pollicipes]|uniref:thioredoxin domain-containing protein 16-like n=2 Tax=Pollicipes pollicipes TaxID=41117 RepID=UPI001884CB3F|nr:thioredoxin domain-containing protein 16-like [Pollicipes pollicipes]